MGRHYFKKKKLQFQQEQITWLSCFMCILLCLRMNWDSKDMTRFVQKKKKKMQVLGIQNRIIDLFHLWGTLFTIIKIYDLR